MNANLVLGSSFFGAHLNLLYMPYQCTQSNFTAHQISKQQKFMVFVKQQILKRRELLDISSITKSSEVTNHNLILAREKD